MFIRLVIVVAISSSALAFNSTPNSITPFEASNLRRDVVTVIPNTMVWPFPESTISSTFGDRPELYWLGHHDGLDFGVDYNTPIPAVVGGTVIFVGWYYGNEVRIQDPSGRYVYRYAHLNDFSVNVGDYVQMGQTIGLVGSTGFSTGPHLHLEILDNGIPVDPYPLLKEKTKVKYK
jgi:murein DD-endopeptidase MepM/ murein hydrolase activator NlpD